MKEFLPEHIPPRGVSDPLGRVVLADLALAATVALVLWPIAAFAHDEKGSLFAFGSSFILIAPLFVVMAHADKTELRRPRDCFMLAGASLLLGLAFFLIDVVLGYARHPGVPLRQAAFESHGPFGYALTLIVCPGLTVFALASIPRALILGPKEPAP